ncbi:MAG: alpha/beta fold hydrolase [Planctomycetes bacterium]|nr:alpha/beta fold hydrolase [Planctomycetota bacterium]
MRCTFAISLLVILTGCASGPGKLDRHFLPGASEWLAEPSMLGRASEAFELPVSAGTITGWFLPGKDTGGRTVVLFHDGRTNASQAFPYYTFLLDAGFHVCVFDYCGFGRSKGSPSIRSAFYDTPKLLDWLCQRKDVDPKKIAWYGIDIGSVVALHAAAHTGGCAALVVEDVPSIRQFFRATTDSGDSVSSTMSVGFAEFVHAPEDCEPSENSKGLSMPSLWITGADRSGVDIRSMMQAFTPMQGDKRLWLIPNTARSPHALMSHDGDYQRTVATFLKAALDSKTDRVAADWKEAAAAEAGGNWFEIALDRVGTDQSPWAVQVAAVDVAGKVTVQNTWLEGSHSKLKMKLESAPGYVAANRILQAERVDLGFKQLSTPLSRAGVWYDAHVQEFDALRNNDPDLARVNAMASVIKAQQQQEPLPVSLEAHLADVYYQIGRVLTAQPDAEQRAAGIIWLRRAVNAAPAKPELQFWPWRAASWGFVAAEQVAAAKALLARIEGPERQQQQQ